MENGDSDRNPRDVKSRTIGQVLSQLDLEFPGISASKIRFLEERGLVHPSRTETGYRKYSQTDIERLRYILTCSAITTCRSRSSVSIWRIWKPVAC